MERHRQLPALHQQVSKQAKGHLRSTLSFMQRVLMRSPGSFDQIDIQGTKGELLREKWAAGPVTYLGTTVHGFPNFLMLVGPQTAASNFPRGAELSVDWVTPFLEHMWARGYQRFDVDKVAEDEWFEHVKGMYEGLLLRNAKSWFTGLQLQYQRPRARQHAVQHLQRWWAKICQNPQ